MNKYLVKRESDGLVVNVVVWDGVSDYSPGDGESLISCSDWPGVWTGWRWDGNEFVPPPEPEPVAE